MKSMLQMSAVGLVLLMTACGGMVDGPAQDGAYSDHEEASDFTPAPSLSGKGDDISPVFDANHIVSDAFFLDSAAMSTSDIQNFLNDTPYGNRSWLAAEVINGQPLAQVIAEASARHNLHPLMILTRFQVEGSHIGKSRHPGTRSASRALGCGCFDGQQCQSSYLGLGKQVECAAATLEKRFNGSVDGSWAWKRGVGKNSLDGIRVTPSSHATAALYAYTPWVLRGRGGNWLVWNITKKFLGHIPDSDTGGTPGPVETENLPLWIGKPCLRDDECGFSHNENFGFCYDFLDVATSTSRGFCSLVCEGFCPDKAGAATTFCMEADVGGIGICTAKSESTNAFCADVPGTIPTEVDRYIGTSTAPAGTATVCRANDI